MCKEDEDGSLLLRLPLQFGGVRAEGKAGTELPELPGAKTYRDEGAASMGGPRAGCMCLSQCRYLVPLVRKARVCECMKPEHVAAANWHPVKGCSPQRPPA